MKKIFLLALLFLPLAGFCAFDYDYNGITVRVDKVRRFLWSSYGKVESSSTSSDSFTVYSEDSLYGYFLGNTFAVALRARNNNTTLIAPGLPGFAPGSSFNQTVTNSLYCTTNGVACIASLLIFPRLQCLYSSVAALVRNGYSGPGFKDVYTSFESPYTYYCINVDFPTLVSDVLSSTNSVYRSLVVSSLSDVNTSLSSIVSSLSSIASRPSSEVWDYDTITNFLRSSNGIYYFNGFDYDLSKIANDVNPANYDFANDPDARAYYDNVLDSYGRGLPLLNALAGAVGSLSSVDSGSNGLNSLGKALNKDVLNALGSGSSGTGIAGDIKRLSTNDWTKGVRDQLQDNRDSITNRLAHMFDDAPNSAGRAIRQTADNTAVSAARASDIASRLNGVIHVQVDNPNNIGVVLDGPVTIDTTQFNGVSVPLSGLKDRVDTWYNDWYSFWDISTPAYSWSNFYNMIRDFEDQNHSDLSAITNSLRGVFSVTGDVSRIYDYLSGSQSNLLEVIASSITNDWDTYYFKRFRRANEFSDEDDQPFTLEGASEAVFGRGFDEGEYSRLNWFSRVELLLFQLSAVSSGTNAIESVDIEDDLNDAVDSFNQHGQDFVNASRRVVGVFQLIDGFAASMRSAFGSYSNPVTHGITLLPAGSWIGDHALVLEVSVTIQNALRLVFQCIWYLSAFVIAWRVVVATWSRVVSFVRWLWSVFDI